MKKNQRINTIRIALLKQKKVYVTDLSVSLNVSERTIRRDLKELVESGIAQLFFGGAELIDIHSQNVFEEAGVKSIVSHIPISDGDNASRLAHRNATNQVLANQSKIDVYVLGSFNIDIVSEVDVFPKRGETLHSIGTSFYAGGKGSNQAISAAKVSNSVHFTVKIGQDEFGDKAKNHLASTEINSFSIFESDVKPTGNAVILVEKCSGENMITIDLGANKTITPEELVNDLPLINDSRIFLTQLENNFDITKLAIEYAKRSEAVVMLNPAPYSEDVKALMHLVDIITPNETEAEGLTGLVITDIASAEVAAKAIYQLGPKVVIITLGAKGALLYDGKRSKTFQPFKAVVTDTSGAGDSFNGALAATLAMGKSLDYAIEYASAFASLAVERKGASNMPNAELVEARLNTKEIV